MDSSSRDLDRLTSREYEDYLDWLENQNISGTRILLQDVLILGGCCAVGGVLVFTIRWGC